MYCGIFPFSLLTTAFLSQVAQSGKKDDWAHHVSLGDDMYHSVGENMEGMESMYDSPSVPYHVYWTAQGEEITFQLEVATKGWVGFGLSPTGGIAGSDIIIGWVSGDKAYLYDYYAKNDATLNVDKNQDWKLLSGTENKTHTVLKFSRRLETCDMQDNPVTNSSQHLIYSSYSTDPSSPVSVNFRQTVWMASYVKLLQPRIDEAPMPEGVSYIDFRVPNYTIPATNQTFYLCQIFRGPTLRKKHHVVQLSPILRPQNIGFLHHFVITSCLIRSTKEAEEAVAFGPTYCYEENLPSLFSRCNNYFVLWGRGAGPFIYPMHVGMPLQEGTQYFQINLHYHNPSFVTGIVDDSGMRIYYTPELRPNDASLLLIGTSPFAPVTSVIPPGERDFIATAHGTPQCISKGMPKDGINIFAIFPHAHLLVKKLKVRHFRNNKELPPIMLDLKYSTHYQEYVYLPRDLNVLPGDQISVECSHDTRGKVVASVNGLSTEEEMCFATFYHHPPTPVTMSASYPPIELVSGLTGMNLAEGNYTAVVQLGEANPEYTDYLQDYDWPESQRCIFQNALRYSPLGSLCYFNDESIVTVPKGTYPENLKPYRFPNQCKEEIRRDRDLTSICDLYH